MDRRSFPDDQQSRDGSGLFSRPEGGGSGLSLAKRPDIAHGNALIRPSLRTITGPAGDVTVEPRVMSVLLALMDAQGRVLTRADLIDRCWAGQTVGDDSINRAISENRRALKSAGVESAIETVPKIGYRLASAALPTTTGVDRQRGGLFSRRALLAAPCGAVAFSLGAIGWRLSRRRPNPQVADLIARGEQALRDEAPNSAEQGMGFLREATRLDAGNPQAWGLLALALRNAAEYAPKGEVATMVSACQAAARRAHALEPGQADAEAALALLPPIYGDWLKQEANLRRVLARHPDQVDLLSGLGLLLFSVGRARAAAVCSERAAGLYPLSPVFQYRRAYHLWTLGRVGEADRTIDRAAQLWPANPSVWYARMLIFAGSERPGAALRMFGDPAAPPAMPPFVDRAWRTTLAALGSGGDRTRAVADQLAAAREGGIGCINAILGLSLIGALDAAFEVAEGYLLERGPLIAMPGVAKTLINDQRWRKTMMLFIPATSRLRADRRFAELCEKMGLVEYWHKVRAVADFRATLT